MNERGRVNRLTPDLTGNSTFSRTLLSIQPVKPSRDQVVDGGFGLALSGLALWGFHATFTGIGYLIVGLLGCLLGVVMAHVAHSLKIPLAGLVVCTVLIFFVIGSVATLRTAPLPGAFSGLVHQLIHGWKNMLTTLPPVDGGGPLLVIPYVLGLVTGAAAQTTAEQSHRSWPPTLVLLTLLGVVILLGVQRPSSLLQGAAFGTLLLVWVTLRGFRTQQLIRNGSARLVRFAMGAGIVAVALITSAPLGSHVLASGADRVVLRDHVSPPFDVGKYPSPLASFRLYTAPSSNAAMSTNLNKTPLFTITGVKRGSLVRIATLDAYDGRTWGAANTGGSPGQIDDTFQRVSSTIDNPLARHGGRHVVRVTIDDGFSGVWMPTVGNLTGLRFSGRDSGRESDQWRYNLASGTAVLPTGLRSGDTYSMVSATPSTRLSPNLGASSDVTVDSGDFLQTDATDWSRDAGDNPLSKVLAIAQHLKTTGSYTDGKAPFQRYTGGHYEGRILSFIEGDQIAGDDEQYAAAMALMANDEGVPARVVLGAEVPQGGVVTGHDVHAWVELRVSDGSWRTLPTSAFIGTKPPNPHPPQVQTNYTGAVVPPPAAIPPPSTVTDPADSDLQTKVQRHQSASHHHLGLGHLPGWVVAVARWVGVPMGVGVGLGALVVGLKARRRHRRRSAQNISMRFSGGWAEVLDWARDLGISLPVGASTRSEQASAIARPEAPPLARSADDHIFGLAEPSAEDAHAFWDGVDRLCQQMGAEAGALRRVLASVKPGTLVALRGRA